MGTILLVDDAVLQHRIMERVLHAREHTIVHAYDGCEGLALTEQQTFTCIVTDLLMPKMTGLEMIETLRARGTNVPIIVVTADVQHTTQARCLAAGASVVLNKPIRFDEFLGAVDNCHLPTGVAQS